MRSEVEILNDFDECLLANEESCAKSEVYDDLFAYMS